MSESPRVAEVSDEAVSRATGRTWSQWRALLDGRGAADLPHKAIAAMLEREGLVESPWWCQQVTVGYEHLIGRRVKGETAGAGFQVGVQRTLPLSVERAWERMLSPAGRTVWLGEVDDIRWEPGARYEARDGTTGEIRSLAVHKRLRLTWQPPGFDAPSTLQVTFDPRKTGTAVRFHHEKLADEAARERMKDRWVEALKQLRDA
jgi:uncharacterized protein YndB with AHSA1/START domain